MIARLHHLNLFLGVVRQHNFEWTQHAHAARRRLAELFAYAVFQHAHFDELVFLGNPTALDEITKCSRGISASSHAGDRRQTWVVPSRHDTAFDQYLEFPLAGNCVSEVESREFNLPRPVFGFQLIEKPIVQRSMILEFQRAERVRHVLDRIGHRMREVVHRINAPLVAGVLMLDMPDTVQRGIAQIHIWRSHVDFCAQHMIAIGKLTVAHTPKQIEIFLHRAIPMRAVLARLSQRATKFANLIRTQAVDIGNAKLDQRFCKRVQLIEVVRRVA